MQLRSIKIALRALCAKPIHDKQVPAYYTASYLVLRLWAGCRETQGADGERESTWVHKTQDEGTRVNNKYELMEGKRSPKGSTLPGRRVGSREQDSSPWVGQWWVVCMFAETIRGVSSAKVAGGVRMNPELQRLKKVSTGSLWGRQHPVCGASPLTWLVDVLFSNQISSTSRRHLLTSPKHSAVDLLLLQLWKLQVSRTESYFLSNKAWRVNEQVAKGADSLRSPCVQRQTYLLGNSAWLDLPRARSEHPWCTGI